VGGKVEELRRKGSVEKMSFEPVEVRRSNGWRQWWWRKWQTDTGSRANTYNLSQYVFVWRSEVNLL